MMRVRGREAQTERKIDARSGRERRQKADRHTPRGREEERPAGGSSFSSGQTPTAWLRVQELLTPIGSRRVPLSFAVFPSGFGADTTDGISGYAEGVLLWAPCHCPLQGFLSSLGGWVGGLAMLGQ